MSNYSLNDATALLPEIHAGNARVKDRLFELLHDEGRLLSAPPCFQTAS
jgi:hypothetical protein